MEKALILTALTCIFVSCFYLDGCEYIEVDKCLDRGGKWDFDNSECIYREDK